MKQVKENRLLIVGLVRDAASTIATEVSNINRAFKGFKEVEWLLIESDSKDNTVEELNKISLQNASFRFFALGELFKAMPKRTERLAYCRNHYLKEIRENSHYRDVDYVAIVDLDNMNDLLTFDAVETCWEKDDWDVCTANQLGPYYDIWALRHPIWSPNDCWSQCLFLQSFGLPHEKAKQAAVYSKQIVIPPNANWIEVDSAFGGLAIYKRSALNEGQYFGLGHSGEEVCDHPFLHETIRNNGGKIFINPKLINTGLTEHTRHFDQKPRLVYL